MHRQNVGSVLTFGNFDGVHLGHKFILSTVNKISQETGLPSAIITFEPHPSTVLFNRKNFRLIDQEYKTELISRCGINSLHVIDFDKGFSQVSCSDFISKILIGQYNAKHIVVGKNCTFGNKRVGNISTLQQYSSVYGYSLVELEPLVIDNEACSSSLIREYLQSGKVDAANKLLGRPYQILGIVKQGARRGREIGSPTINIPIENYMIKPKFGTYYATMTCDDQNWLHGVVNIGMRPTFKDLQDPIAEMHILDFNKDLYGQMVKIQLLQFMRSERKFCGVDELKEQINCDIIEAYRLKACI
ncbi:MAG: riboflavin biosynthesis protein RibF [Wolbachia endosymbiont of Tyrophagus putrescentiae]|nr:riboflavin biosynthesis protein RibF [Wolbachia endosymbiont of Tyrophagus putrescentiae]